MLHVNLPRLHSVWDSGKQCRDFIGKLYIRRNGELVLIDNLHAKHSGNFNPRKKFWNTVDCLVGRLVILEDKFCMSNIFHTNTNSVNVLSNEYIWAFVFFHSKSNLLEITWVKTYSYLRTQAELYHSLKIDTFALTVFIQVELNDETVHQEQAVKVS